MPTRAFLSSFRKVQEVVLGAGAVSYVPSGGVRMIIVHAVGGGGSGGGAATGVGAATGSGGGAGAYAKKRIDSPNTVLGYPIAVGLGGAAPAAGQNPGLVGGDTTFGSPAIITAKGGAGGAAAAVPAAAAVVAGGAGGASAASVGDTVVDGEPGGPGIVLSATLALTGAGGHAHGPLSGVGAAGAAVAGAGAAGLGNGGGGAGGANVNNSAAVAGGAGAPGYILVEEFV